MPRQRRSLPGAILLLVLIGLAVALGVYGNKFSAPTSGSPEMTSTTGIPTETQSPAHNTTTSETVTTAPTNTTQGTT